MKTLDQQELARRTDKLRRSWAKQAPRYDKQIGFFERRVFGRSHRPWACSRASDDVLEVAIGTALNLPYYSQDVRLVGLDLSAEMLDIAHDRAHDLGRQVELREGDAHNLSFPDASFDTVVCTYSLCNIPDPQLAVSEMRRVLRPAGKLILVDHIRSRVKPIFWLQNAFEFITARLEGEHMTRRPAEYVEAARFDIVERERLGPAGVIERLVALKPH
jgi:ubiquinone/menaquinone biosynthesis C-methylase UbiE